MKVSKKGLIYPRSLELRKYYTTVAHIDPVDRLIWFWHATSATNETIRFYESSVPFKATVFFRFAGHFHENRGFASARNWTEAIYATQKRRPRSLTAKWTSAKEEEESWWSRAIGNNSWAKNKKFISLSSPIPLPSRTIPGIRSLRLVLR